MYTHKDKKKMQHKRGDYRNDLSHSIAQVGYTCFLWSERVHAFIKLSS